VFGFLSGVGYLLFVAALLGAPADLADLALPCLFYTCSGVSGVAKTVERLRTGGLRDSGGLGQLVSAYGTRRTFWLEQSRSRAATLRGGGLVDRPDHRPDARSVQQGMRKMFETGEPIPPVS
jgi:hypothetical protein